jgi:hypothetical protein
MVFSPLGISAEDAEKEVRHAWQLSYDPATTAAAMEWLETKSLPDRIIHLLARLAFRGIYFPQMRWQEWVRLLCENRTPILHLVHQALEMKFRPRPKDSLPIDTRPAIEGEAV